jgi:serine/threonine-protein kinase
MTTRLDAGSELAGYRIERVLGRGGMGVVYLAEDLRLKRPAAIKVVKAELADDPRFRERFLRESQLAARLDHPSIVPVYSAGEADGVLYLAMRYVAGRDLRSTLAEDGPLEPERALRILGQVADALDAAHAVGLVHRDVKAGNVLLAGDPTRRSEHAYLADFGLAKRPATADSATGSGALLGTIAYAAPEQIEGAAVDGRADIYSLGCLLYECLSGSPPFPAESDLAIVFAHLQQPPPRISETQPQLPAALDPVIARALAKRPADRYPTAIALIDAAREALPSTSSPARRSGPLRAAAALAVVGVVTLAATAYVASRGGGTPDVASSQPAVGDAVVAIDARTARITRRMPLPAGGAPVEIVVAGGTLWVAETRSDSVAQVDPRTGFLRNIPVPGLTGLAADGDAVWAVGHAQDGSKVLRLIDPVAGRPTQSVPLPETDAPVAVGGGFAWFARDPGDGFPTLIRVATDGSDQQRTIPVRKAALLGPIVFANGAPFALAADRPDGMTEHVIRGERNGSAVTIASMAHRGHAFDSGFEEIAAAPSSLWALAMDGTLWQIDPVRGVVADSFRLGSGTWVGLAADDTAVWAANAGDATVVRFDPATHATTRIRLPGMPQSVVVSGGAVYVPISAVARRQVPAGPATRTLRILAEDDYDFWDGTSFFGDVGQIEFVTCNGLLDYLPTPDPSKQGRLVPGVASAWPDVSADRLTYTFHIRRGLRFHDGRRVTPEDVRDTFLRNLDPKANFLALTTGYFDDIAGLDAYLKGTAPTITGIRVDGDRVSFHLTKPDPTFPYATAQRVMCIVPRRTPHAHSNLPPSMTGPFQIVSYDPGTSIVLKRNANGTENSRLLGRNGGPVGVDRIEITFGFTPREQVAAIAAGRGDLTLADPRDAATSDQLADPGLAKQLATAPFAGLAYVSLGTNRGPFANPVLRRAVNLAIDRTAIARAAGVRSRRPWSSYLPSTLLAPGASSAYADQGDPAAARGLIASSGLRTPIKVELWYFSGQDEIDALVGEVKRQLDGAGFAVTLRPAWGSFYFGAMADPDQHVDMALFNWAQDYPDPVTILPPLLRTGAENNHGHFSSPSLDRQMAQVDTLPLGTARRAAWSRIASDVARGDAPLLVLTDLDIARLRSTRVRGLVMDAQMGADLALLTLGG